MKFARFAARLVVCVIPASIGVTASADVIDPFTAPQGPFSVGPGEAIPEEQAVVFSDSILGGFRVAGPAVDEDAQAGSTATLTIGGGSFDCAADFPGPHPDNNAGCVGDYDRGEGPVFDLTGSTRFLFDVRSVEGDVAIGVTLVDTNEEISVGLIPVLAPGQIAMTFDSMFPVTSLLGVDLSLIDNIAFVPVYVEGGSGRIVINEFSTDGPIAEGPVIPVDDGVAAEEIPGTYFNPLRDGEGCQLTLERDGVTFVLTCYFYKDGEQFWVIGVGTLVNGQIAFAELIITEGPQYGDAFDPADVLRSVWGSATMTWGDCNNAALDLVPILPGYEQITLDLTRIVPTVCGGGGVPADLAAWMGAFFDPLRDGEGFHFGVEAGGIFVMTWYTYLNGKQVWMIGTGTQDGARVVFDEMIITSGADFGSGFDPAEVVREVFGTITVDFSDCNNFTATVDSVLPEFQDIVLQVTKIVPGACP